MKPLSAALCALLCPVLAHAGQTQFVQSILENHPEPKRAEAELAALRGRRQTASASLPSQPILSLTGAGRFADGASTFNGSVALSQELEIAGQRGARVDLADAELNAAEHRLQATRRELAVTALAVWFDVIAARQRVELADKAATVAEHLNAWASQAAAEGLISVVEADLVRSEAIQISLERTSAERELGAARAACAALEGGATCEGVDGANLEPPALIQVQALPEGSPTDRLVEHALQNRTDVGAVEAERRAAEARLSLAKKLWAPNPSVSAFAERDGFDENVFGVGLAFPLPLPLPIWPGPSGAIAEQDARLKMAGADLERTRRRIRQEVAAAVAADEARQRSLALFDHALLQRATDELEAISEEASARRITVRDAVFAQRSLLALLNASRDARVQAISARLELLRVAALPIPGVNP